MESPRPPFRPLVWAVPALAAGSWLGASEPAIDAAMWRWAVLATLAAAVVCACLATRARTDKSGAASRAPHSIWTALSRARGAGGTARSRAPVWTACALLTALGGLRARDEASAPFDREGRFEPRREFDGTVRGPLTPGSLEVEIQSGLVEPGERVAIRGGRAAVERARGPVAAPPPRYAAPRVTVLPDEVVRLGPPGEDVGGSVQRALERWRRVLGARLLAIEDREARGYVAALVLGDLGGLDMEVPDLFVRTGTFHALAVSGVQVVLVAAVVLAPFVALVGFLARRFGSRRAHFARELARAAALSLYVPIAGAGPPVARAALAFALARMSPLIPTREFALVRVRRTTSSDRTSGSNGDSSVESCSEPHTPVRADAAASHATCRLSRRADGVALWCLALLVECALHPRAAAELSVQLSFAATLGLVLGTAPLRRVLSLPVPRAVDALGRPRSPLLRACAVRVQVAFVGAVSASLAAVAATLPFVWWRLGEWSPLGVFATLAIAGPAAALLFLGWIAAIAPGCVPELLLVAPARAMTASLRMFDALPGTPEALPPRPVWLVGAAVALAFAALTLRSDETRRRAARVSAVLFAVLLVPWTTAPRALEVHALDVGHGTCCIVRAPGLGTWVFDAGSRDRTEVARAALAPALRAWDVGRIGVVLSHPDRDHDGAVPWLVGRFDVAAYGGALPAQVAERLPHSAPRFDLARGRMALPALQGSCPGVAAWLERGEPVPGNEGSRTLRIEWFGEQIVLTGDAEAEGLRAWLADMPRSEKGASLLLAPHHGSEIERLGLLLDAVRPAEVWISGPARPPIAGELDRRGIPWRSTGSVGPLHFERAPPHDATCWNGACWSDPP